VSNDFDININSRWGKLRAALTSGAAGTALLVAAYGAASTAVLSIVGVLIAICLGYDIEYNLKEWSFKFKPPVHRAYEAGSHEEFKPTSKQWPLEVIPDKSREVPTGSIPIAENAPKSSAPIAENKPKMPNPSRTPFYYEVPPGMSLEEQKRFKRLCPVGFDMPEVCYMPWKNRLSIPVYPAR
jgi:hypothetical protein